MLTSSSRVSRGSTIQLSTHWSETCKKGGGWIATQHRDERLVDCNAVTHSLTVHCKEPCRITAPDQRHETGSLTWGPTNEPAEFSITTDADLLTVDVTFEHRGSSRTIQLDPIPFVVARDVVVECGYDVPDRPPSTCDEEYASDSSPEIIVKSASKIVLGAVRINGKLARNGRLALRVAVPASIDPSNQQPGTQNPFHLVGDYPVVIEVGAGPDAIRRETVVHIRERKR